MARDVLYHVAGKPSKVSMPYVELDTLLCLCKYNRMSGIKNDISAFAAPGSAFERLAALFQKHPLRNKASHFHRKRLRNNLGTQVSQDLTRQASPNRSSTP
jgi:hypothetical protein